MESVDRKIFAFINSGSGSSSADELADWLRGEIPEQRLGEVYVVGEKGDFQNTIHKAIKACREVDGMMLLVGGDGTVNAWLPYLHDYKIPFALLPAGTFNLLARDLGIPEDFDAALKVALEGNPKPIGMGSVNGNLFTISVSVGLHPTLIEMRERHTKVAGRHRIVAWFSGLWTLLTKVRLLRARLIFDNLHRWTKTPMVVVSLSPLQLQPLGVEFSRHDRESGFAVVLMKARRPWQLFSLLLHGIVTGKNDKELLDVNFKEKSRLELRRKKIKVAIDGEVTHLPTPLEFRYLPDALQFVYPDNIKEPV